MEVAATCMSLAGAAATISLKVADLIVEIRDLKGDLELVRVELDSIQGLLFLIADHIYKTSREGTAIAKRLTERLGTDVERCRSSVQDTSDLVTKYARGGFLRITGWLLVGKGELVKLRDNLANRKQDLDISLNMLTMSMTAVVRLETAQILTSNVAIQQDVQGIMAAIQSLQTDQVKMAELLETLRAMSTQQTDNFVLDKFLDSLTTYAESVYARSVIDADEPAQPFPDSPRNSFSGSDAETVLEERGPRPSSSTAETLTFPKRADLRPRRDEKLASPIDPDFEKRSRGVPATAANTFKGDDKRVTNSVSNYETPSTAPTRSRGATRHLLGSNTALEKSNREHRKSHPRFPELASRLSGLELGKRRQANTNTNTNRFPKEQVEEWPRKQTEVKDASATLSARLTEAKLSDRSTRDVSRGAEGVQQSSDTKAYELEQLETTNRVQEDLDAQISCITADTLPDEIVDLIQRGANPKGCRWQQGQNPSSWNRHPGVPCINCFPLTNAARAGNAACVEVLLKHGADPQAVLNGPTNLFWAVYHGHAKVVRLLLAAGSNPNERASMWRSNCYPPTSFSRGVSCMGSCTWLDGYSRRTLLTTAMMRRRRVDQRHDVDPATRTQIVNDLLEHGAAPNELGVLGGSDYPHIKEHPIAMALYNGDMEIVELLCARRSTLSDVPLYDYGEIIWSGKKLSLTLLVLISIKHSSPGSSGWLAPFVHLNPSLCDRCLLEVVRSIGSIGFTCFDNNDLLELARNLVAAGANVDSELYTTYIGAPRRWGGRVRQKFVTALQLVDKIHAQDGEVQRQMRKILRDK